MSSSASVVSAADVHEALHAPLTFVQRALDAHAATLAPPAARPADPLDAAAARAVIDGLAASDWGVEASLSRVLGLCLPRSSAACALARIPSLNALHPHTRDVSHVRPGQLVRFRGMVQETMQPEFFAGLFQRREEGERKQGEVQEFTTANICSGKYRDVVDVQTTRIDAHECMLERLSVNVVPIPGESEWVGDAWRSLEAQSGHAAPTPAASSAAPASVAKSTKKRGLDSDSSADAMSDETGAAAASSAASAADATTAAVTPQKKGKSDASATAASASKDGAAQNGASLPVERGLEVIVTVYDSLAKEPSPVARAANSSAAAAAAPAADGVDAPRSALRVGDIYEFVGVLSVVPDLKAELESDSMDDLGAELWGPRRTQALRMHALAAVPIEHGHPFIAHPTKESALFATQRTEIMQVLPAVRASLLAFLTQLLGGDALAGEVLLLFLLQRLHGRGGAASARPLLGKLVLNLIAPVSPASHPTAATEFASRLHAALQNILPRVSKLGVNIDTLNAQTWQPKKNYDDESLESNLLHLSSPSFLLLDETSLSAGTLSSLGITNLRVLCKLLAESQLEYDFLFQTLDFPVEHAVCIVTQGSKSITSQDGHASVDVALKIVPSSLEALYGSQQQMPAPSNEQLNFWRAFLLTARQTSFSISPALAANIQDWFVSLRQRRASTTNESTLHLLLNLARLHALSWGETELKDEERLKEVFALFERIHARQTSAA